MVIHEAKKAFKLANKKWDNDFTVHHINLNTLDNNLSNLAIFTDNGEHHKHHYLMELAMYEFIVSSDLLDDFYKKNPQLKLDSLENLI